MAPHWELILRLVAAAALGSLVGAERERLMWAAGLRTHMLVSVGACLFMIVSAYGFAGVTGDKIILDPSRVAAQVVSGIGFLGAGSILMRGDLIRGLTTAASLWSVAALGLAVGGGLYREAAAATVIILVILAGIKPIEKWIQNRNQTLRLRLRVASGRLPFDELQRRLDIRERKISRYYCVPSADAGFDEVSISIKRVHKGDMAALIRKLSEIPDVTEVVRL
jgi:putative Mg2+ transporter-C (MgtC) family protein